MLLILFGIALLLLEIKVTSHGVLGIGGIASLLFGSLMLFDSDAPEMRVSLSLLLPVVAGLTVVLVGLVRLGLAAQRTRPTTGEEGMVGESGRVMVAIAPGVPGQVVTHGEIWNARASEELPVGAEVVVTRVEGLTVEVTRK